MESRLSDSCLHLKDLQLLDFLISNLIGISHRMKINLIPRIAHDWCTGFLKIFRCSCIRPLYGLHLAMADYTQASILHPVGDKRYDYIKLGNKDES